MFLSKEVVKIENYNFLSVPSAIIFYLQELYFRLMYVYFICSLQIKKKKRLQIYLWPVAFLPLIRCPVYVLLELTDQNRTLKIVGISLYFFLMEEDILVQSRLVIGNEFEGCLGGSVG